MTTPRRYSLIFAMFITLLMLTGCGSAPEQPDTKAPAPDLSSAPALILTPDQPDGTGTIEIRSGNFNWQYKNDDETMTGGIACGAHPLDDEELSHTAVLSLARYNETISVPYTFSCLIMPDKLILCKWSLSDLGNFEAQGNSSVMEPPADVLELEAGYVYEFTAVWSEDKLNENGFYGTASYVLAAQPETD